MSATKDIRLVLLRGQFDRMFECRRTHEPVVSFIRGAIDQEIRRRTSGRPEALGALADLHELIQEQLKPDETVDKFIRSCVAQGLKIRLKQRLAEQAVQAIGEREAAKAREAAAQQVTACPTPQETPPTAVRMPTMAERAAALIEEMAERKRRKEQEIPQGFSIR